MTEVTWRDNTTRPADGALVLMVYDWHSGGLSGRTHWCGEYSALDDNVDWGEWSAHWRDVVLWAPYPMPEQRGG